MKTKEFTDQAQKEMNEISKALDQIVDDYIKKSKMPQNQKIVNIGRALNAYHIGWVGNLNAQLEKATSELIRAAGSIKIKPLSKVAKDLK